ncbi:MAG: carboxypeptidase-like regulatory domain-containing protein [Pyrinomonadaceae bacterium]
MQRFVLLALVTCLMAFTAMAQSNTGSLTGTVSDASGVIPGATVVVKDNQTGRERTLTTSGEGTFSLSQLEVGEYTVTVSAPGHKTYTATDVKIDVSRTFTLNPALEVGAITENVTVVGGADLVNASNGELSTTVTSRQIVELPLNGRNPLSLVLLQAGTSSNSNQNTVINGTRSSFTNITRDGLNVQDNFIRANAVDFLPDRPNVDDTGEFTIVTQNAGAESGYGASQVQLVTPRGSNDFHGAVYLYNRNSHYAANNYFNNASRVVRPFLNRNQFGGKAGGPILKNKLFFFAAYEGFRLRQSTSTTRTTLTPNAKGGLFTYNDASGVTRTVNVFNAGFGHGVAGIDPTVQARVLALLPAAGNAQGGDGLNTTSFIFSKLQNQDREAFTSRIDYDISPNQSINGVFSYKKELLLRPDIDGGVGGAGSGYIATPDGFQDAHTKFLALSWRWSPWSTLTNEVRGGLQKSDPIFGRSTALPAFFFSTPLINSPESAFQAQGRYTDYVSVQDNAVWTKGEHSFRFGGGLQQFRINPFGPPAFAQSTIPTFNLGGGTVPVVSLTTFNATNGCVVATGVNCASQAQATTYNNLLALLGGLVGSGNLTFNASSQTSGYVPNFPPNRNLAYDHWSLYFTDQWRATRRLTLNLGLRYELFTGIKEENGLAIEAVIPNLADPRSALLNPAGTYNFVGTNLGEGRFFGTDTNNIAPVLSFAYAPDFGNSFLKMLFPGNGKTVFRGGFRMSYVNDEFVRSADNALAGNQGVTQAVTLAGLNARLNALPAIATPAAFAPRPYTFNNDLANNFGTVFGIDPNMEVPVNKEFNIGFEREIGWQTAVEVRYVHGQSNNLVRGLDLNQQQYSPAFVAEFNRARNNLFLPGATTANCTAATPGCQPLQIFNMAPFSLGFLNNGTIIANIRNGEVGTFTNNMLAGFGIATAANAAASRAMSALVLPNPNTGVVDLLGNFAKYRYNSFQAEFRRRFANGLAFQANYTFQKALTDAPGTGQTRFEPLIDNNDPDAEYFRADYDTAHVFNFNAIYELPFGKGKKWLGNIGPWANRLIGGWQLTSIIRASTGAPLSITDPRGTFNRSGRSGRQSATTSLTKDEIKNLFGVFRTKCGVYFIDPAVININLDTCGPRAAGTTAGTGSNLLQAPFSGQVFFNNGPFSKGNIEGGFINGPFYFNWDASIIKNIQITERMRFQMRAEAFNVLNNTNFAPGGQFTTLNINSSTFGRLTTSFSGRIMQFVGRFEF